MQNLKEFEGFVNESEFDFSQPISSLESAKMKMEEAVDDIKMALSQLRSFPYSSSTYERLRSYILGNLEPLISEDHGWMTRSVNIQEIIDEIREMGEEEMGEEEN
jgi:hypothetical protein